MYVGEDEHAEEQQDDPSDHADRPQLRTEARRPAGSEGDAKHTPGPVLPSERKISVIPWTTMSSPFAVESWDWFMPLTSADTFKIEAFYQDHLDQSPESNQAP